MNPTRQELEQEFARLSDEELLARCAPGILTEEARPIALKEAHLRGLNPAESPPAAEQEETWYGDFVIVLRDLNMAEANLYTMLLKNAGIPAEVGDANFSRAYGSMYSANVKVPQGFVIEARELLAAFKRGDFMLDEDFKPDGA